MTSKYIKPIKVITSENTMYINKIINDYMPQAIFYNYADKNEIPKTALIKKGGYVLLDFGRELVGGINITTESIDGDDARLRIVFGESAMEAMSEPGYKNANNNHSVRDIEVAVTALSSQTYGDTGFRFVKLQAINADIEIHTVKAVSSARDIEYKGSFECNDTLINEIWKTGAYTVSLNMHDYLWDGVKRDRLVWIGDMHPELSVINAVFGKDKCVTNSLDLIKEITPKGEWMNGFASYSMWWIIIQYDYYMHEGDLDYLKSSKQCLINITDHTFEWIDSGYNINKESDFVTFVDWSSKGSDSEFAGAKAMMILGLSRAAKLFEYLEDNRYSQKCMSYAEKLRDENINQALNKQMSALCLLADINSESAEKALEGDSAKDMSCFMGYYILLAKAKMKEYDKALDIIRKYWGGMIEMGATSFWEEFDVEWMKNSARIDEIASGDMNDIHGDFGEHCYTGYRKSLCHGWASGPTAFLSEKIGGIEILEPGCAKMKISPNLGGLKWVKIKYPTPYGALEIFAEESGNIEVSAPDEIEIVK